MPVKLLIGNLLHELGALMAICEHQLVALFG